MINFWRKGRAFALLLLQFLWRVGVGLLVLVLVVVACRLLFLAYEYHFDFDKARWAASAVILHPNPEDAYDNPRQGMVADVLAHELRPGMSRAAVLAILGPADSGATDEPLVWRYETGWQGIDPTGLEVEFSEQGTLVRAYERE